jgi:hypothetical protein
MRKFSWLGAAGPVDAGSLLLRSNENLWRQKARAAPLVPGAAIVFMIASLLEPEQMGNGHRRYLHS